MDPHAFAPPLAYETDDDLFEEEDLDAFDDEDEDLDDLDDLEEDDDLDDDLDDEDDFDDDDF